MNRDSLLNLLASAKDDANTVELYINIGQQYESNDPETAKQYYLKARDLSRRINFPLGEIKYITNYTFVLNMQGYFDSSLLLNLQSVELSKKIKDSQYLAKTLFNTGSSYRLKEDYEQAVKYYQEGKDLFEKFGNKLMEAQASDVLQNLYTGMRQYRKGITYGLSAVKSLKEIDNLSMLGTAYNNLGLNYLNLLLFDSAKICFKKALDIAQKIGDQNMEINQYLNMGNVMLGLGEINFMKSYMEKALPLSRKLKLYESEVIALKGFSFYHFYKKNYLLAKTYADSALYLVNKFDFRNERQKLYTHLSNLAYSMQDVKLGEYYALQNSLLSDSILNKTIQNSTLELEKKYETQKKQSQINRLESQTLAQMFSIRQKNTLNYILAGSAAAILIISLQSYRTYKSRQKLQQQKIDTLETEKQLAATEAVLKGEEQERTRLAKDLHDGLGGMLSGIKYSFINMKGNLVMTPDNAQAFERSMDMLDSSIREMRRVAHNMMPEALVKFGLDTALRDFCNDINQSGALQVTYQSMGMSNAILNHTTAITIYRIVQELVNNTMKHASATAAIVQLTKTDGHLSLTIEDDGEGFDTAILKKSKGIGWSNIQNRIEFLKGKCDVDSKPGEGTSVHIEIIP